MQLLPLRQSMWTWHPIYKSDFGEPGKLFARNKRKHWHKPKVELARGSSPTPRCCPVATRCFLHMRIDQFYFYLFLFLFLFVSFYLAFSHKDTRCLRTDNSSSSKMLTAISYFASKAEFYNFQRFASSCDGKLYFNSIRWPTIWACNAYYCKSA